MDATEHAYAAIIALTQYEIANQRNNTAAAAAYLAEAMRRIIYIAKQLPAKEGARLPERGENDDRLCMYTRCMDELLDIVYMLQRPRTADPRDSLVKAWDECRRLAEYHGWMLPEMQPAALVPANARQMVRVR